MKSIFNIQECKFLEDLSGKKFYPYPDSSFPSSISSEVYVRQNLPKKVPLVIYRSESRFVFSNGAWNNSYWEVKIGYSNLNKNMRITYIQFKDLISINIAKKISKVYQRLVRSNYDSFLQNQIFVHRCETDWKDIINWNQQPIYRPEPYSSIILSEVEQISFYWDVTDIWVSGILPNYGIVLKTNNTHGIPSSKNFHNNDPVKRPALLVYYTN